MGSNLNYCELNVDCFVQKRLNTNLMIIIFYHTINIQGINKKKYISLYNITKLNISLNKSLNISLNKISKHITK